jgi:hypothetical protein
MDERSNHVHGAVRDEERATRARRFRRFLQARSTAETKGSWAETYRKIGVRLLVLVEDVLHVECEDLRAIIALHRFIRASLGAAREICAPAATGLWGRWGTRRRMGLQRAKRSMVWGHVISDEGELVQCYAHVCDLAHNYSQVKKNMA